LCTLSVDVVRCQEAEVSSLTRSNDLLLMEAETRRQTRVQRADQMEGVRGHVDRMARRLQFMQITTADIEESKVNRTCPVLTVPNNTVVPVEHGY
jgi:hypothetical protein